MIFSDFDIPELGAGLDAFFKAGVAVAFVFYIIFAFVIVKQVAKMTETLEVGLEGVLRLFAYLHLLFSIGAFAVAFFIL